MSARKSRMGDDAGPFEGRVTLTVAIPYATRDAMMDVLDDFLRAMGRAKFPKQTHYVGNIDVRYMDAAEVARDAARRKRRRESRP